MRKADMHTLLGDFDLVAAQMKTTLAEQHQIARNFSRLAYAVLDAVQFLNRNRPEDALEVCLQAMNDVSVTAYENDYDTEEWVANWLGDSK